MSIDFNAYYAETYQNSIGPVRPDNYVGMGDAALGIGKYVGAPFPQYTSGINVPLPVPALFYSNRVSPVAGVSGEGQGLSSYPLAPNPELPLMMDFNTMDLYTYEGVTTMSDEQQSDPSNDARKQNFVYAGAPLGDEWPQIKREYLKLGTSDVASANELTSCHPLKGLPFRIQRIPLIVDPSNPLVPTGGAETTGCPSGAGACGEVSGYFHTLVSDPVLFTETDEDKPEFYNGVTHQWISKDGFLPLSTRCGGEKLLVSGFTGASGDENATPSGVSLLEFRSGFNVSYDTGTCAAVIDTSGSSGARISGLSGYSCCPDAEHGYEFGTIDCETYECLAFDDTFRLSGIEGVSGTYQVSACRPKVSGYDCYGASAWPCTEYNCLGFSQTDFYLNSQAGTCDFDVAWKGLTVRTNSQSYCARDGANNMDFELTSVKYLDFGGNLYASSYNDPGDCQGQSITISAYTLQITGEDANDSDKCGEGGRPSGPDVGGPAFSMDFFDNDFFLKEENASTCEYKLHTVGLNTQSWIGTKDACTPPGISSDGAAGKLYTNIKQIDFKEGFYTTKINGSNAGSDAYAGCTLEVSTVVPHMTGLQCDNTKVDSCDNGLVLECVGFEPGSFYITGWKDGDTCKSEIFAKGLGVTGYIDAGCGPDVSQGLKAYPHIDSLKLGSGLWIDSSKSQLRDKGCEPKGYLTLDTYIPRASGLACAGGTNPTCHDPVECFSFNTGTFSATYDSSSCGVEISGRPSLGVSGGTNTSCCESGLNAYVPFVEHVSFGRGLSLTTIGSINNEGCEGNSIQIDACVPHVFGYSGCSGCNPEAQYEFATPLPANTFNFGKGFSLTQDDCAVTIESCVDTGTFIGGVNECEAEGCALQLNITGSLCGGSNIVTTTCTESTIDVAIELSSSDIAACATGDLTTCCICYKDWNGDNQSAVVYAPPNCPTDCYGTSNGSCE